QVLGTTRAGKLALWQVMARVIDQGSRLSAVRLARSHAACDVLGLGTFDEDVLYENLDWLAGAQARIEDRLFAQRKKTTPASLFLYDVTSSYLEGTHNAQTWPRHPFHQCGNIRLYSAPVGRACYAVWMSSKSHNCCTGTGRCPGRPRGLG